MFHASKRLPTNGAAFACPAAAPVVHYDQAAEPVAREVFKLETAVGVIMSTTVQTKDKAVSLIIEHQKRIKALGVNKLGLFGSFVREEQDARSDVDVLVEFEPGKKTYDNFMQLALFLEALFKRQVELVTTESLSPYIGPHIEDEVEYVPLIA